MGKRFLYYQRERTKGRTVSALLHLFFLLIILVGLPDFLMPHPPEEPAAITVELLPITGITNIKPQEKVDAPKPKPEPKPEAKPVNQKEAPPVKTADAAPPPPPAPVAIPKPEKPKDTKKPDEKKPDKADDKNKDKNKAKTEDLAAVLKAVKDQAQKDKKPDKKDTGSQTPAKSNQYNANLPMSMSEKDAIRSQIAKNWNVPAGAKDAHALVVTLDIELQQDGTVSKVEISSGDKSRYNSDTFFRAAADSAVRAVYVTHQIQGLPPEKYDTWRDMELTFDPKEMLF